MQPPRPPPAAVVARSAGSVRRLALSGSARRLGLRWQRPSSRAQSAASLPHYGTRETRSRLRQSTSRMNGLFAGGFWARHALLGEIRALRRNLGRDSYVPQIAGRDPDTANVFGQELDAQEPPSVQMSPDNEFIVQMSPENEAVSESRPKRRQRQDIEPANTHSVRISPENAIPVRMPREGLRSRPYTRPNVSNAVATPLSHTGSVT